MIKIAHKVETGAVKHLPLDVLARVVEIATNLDDNYGKSRDVERDLGGYILIAETADDVETIKKVVAFQDMVPEYVDLISCPSL